jgi:hypothetical protein
MAVTGTPDGPFREVVNAVSEIAVAPVSNAPASLLNGLPLGTALRRAHAVSSLINATANRAHAPHPAYFKIPSSSEPSSRPINVA